MTRLIRSATEKARLVVTLGAFICLAGCQAPTSNVQQDESAVREVFDRYIKSVNAADLPLASEVWLQSADVVAVTPFGRFQGWDQVRDEVYIKFLQQSLTERDLQPSNVSIHTMGDSAWLAFRLGIQGKDGDWSADRVEGLGEPCLSTNRPRLEDRALALFSPAASATSVTVSDEVAWSAVALAIAMGVGRSRRSRLCPTHHHRLLRQPHTPRPTRGDTS